MKSIVNGLIIMLTGLSSFASITLKGKTFQFIEGLVFNNVKNNYKLIPYNSAKFESDITLIQFYDSTFRIYKTAECGSECRKEIIGNYMILEDKLMIENIYLKYNELCLEENNSIVGKVFFKISDSNPTMHLQYLNNPFQNILSNKKFVSSGVPFEKKTRKEYFFSIPREGNVWGHFIEFSDSTFHSYYQASCGNDCFTVVNGEYQIDNDLINIIVTDVKKKGMCLDPDDYEIGDYGKFIIEINVNGIRATKK